MIYCSYKLTRLRSSHPLRNLNLTISVAYNSVSEDLVEFIPQWSKEPSDYKLPRKQWVQLNRLRSRSGRFADDMHRWFAKECMWLWFRSPNLHPHPTGVPHLETIVLPQWSRPPPFAKLSTKVQFLTWVVFFMFFFVYTNIFTDPTSNRLSIRSKPRIFS